MEENLKLEIKISSKELRYFSLCHTYRSFSGMFGLFFSSAMLIAAIYFYGKVETSYFVLLLLMGCLFTVWNPLLLFWKAHKQGKNPTFSQPLYYTFSDKGLELEQGQQKAEFLWDDIRKVVGTKKCYFIYMSQLRAYIVPKEQIAAQERDLLKMVIKHLPAGRRKGIKGDIE